MLCPLSYRGLRLGGAAVWRMDPPAGIAAAWRMEPPAGIAAAWRMEPPAGIEPAAFRVGAGRSVR